MEIYSRRRRDKVILKDNYFASRGAKKGLIPRGLPRDCSGVLEVNTPLLAAGNLYCCLLNIGLTRKS
jgi:hypothetical protein